MFLRAAESGDVWAGGKMPPQRAPSLRGDLSRAATMRGPRRARESRHLPARECAPPDVTELCTSLNYGRADAAFRYPGNINKSLYSKDRLTRAIV
ncbi:unnamed protein product, partial [Iphiclides podalirius]